MLSPFPHNIVKTKKIAHAVRAKELVSKMTLLEKTLQMLHSAPAIPRLGIPAYQWWNEALHGVARAGLATVFPQAIGRAATFDPALEKKTASAISDEARAKFNEFQKKGYTGVYSGLTFWSPNINIFRDPRWGRGQETFGEDPYLTSRIGVAFVEGIQGNDPNHLKAAACAKHYAVHSGPEMGRASFNSVVSLRDLYETYLPAFEALVREAKVESVMGAYNAVNGEPCNASPTMLDKILRGQFGFQGHVVSDCGAIENIYLEHKTVSTAWEAAALSVRAGCDLCCGCAYEALTEAVERGAVSEEEITRSVERLFTTRYKLGLFDPPSEVKWSRISPDVVCSPKHRRLASQCAEASIVLLKNDGILPLNAKKTKSLGVCGPLALDATAMLGNYNGFSGEITTYLSGIVARGGAGLHVSYVKGCELFADSPIQAEGLEYCFREVDAIIACVGLSPEIEGEAGDAFNADAGGDRRRISLPGRQQAMLEFLCGTGKPVIVVVSGGSAVDLTWAHENCAAVLMAWYPGETAGEALAKILFGDVSPSGRLPITFYRENQQFPPLTDYAMGAGRTYRYPAETPPLYPFGHGLSYATFAYSKLKLKKKIIKAGETAEVTVTVKNTGKMTAAEIVQLYISDVEATVPVPRLHLEGFQRILLRPNESRDVSFRIAPRQFAAFDDTGEPFIEPGEFRISLGGSQPGYGKTVETMLTIRN